MRSATVTSLVETPLALRPTLMNPQLSMLFAGLCLGLVLTVTSAGRVPYEPISSGQNLSLGCPSYVELRELSGLTTCISDNLDSCTEVSIKNEIKAIKDIVQYICSDDGRQVVLDLADSQCNDDPTLELRMEMMMHGCLENFQIGIQMAQFQAIMDGREFQVSEVCPFTDQLETCIVNGAADMCGSAMGTFMTNIWHIAASDQFAQFGCVHDTDHRLVKVVAVVVGVVVVVMVVVVIVVVVVVIVVGIIVVVVVAAAEVIIKVVRLAPTTVITMCIACFVLVVFLSCRSCREANSSHDSEESCSPEEVQEVRHQFKTSPAHNHTEMSALTDTFIAYNEVDRLDIQAFPTILLSYTFSFMFVLLSAIQS
ncbi:hypothetical protein ElyMa_003060000 [Elysia marginata]|uniref:Protein TsetseEP domain-containing protein n=1 Tax=Elysia marginata TaxID=1093978 RepID=A0AAV4IKK9_9GAST|nr:hypothetical protein ElyMa_003060000 [Elysia marginata]